MNETDLIGLTLMGEGSHGKVFRLDENRCIKVCKKEKHIQMEFRVLKHSERFSHFPRVYECSGRYMVREYFDGPTTHEYIKRCGLSESLSKQLLEIIDIFKELGYTRLDCKLNHIIVTNGENLKVIDPTRNMDKIAQYPRRMLEDLDKLGFKEIFLQYVKELRPDYYDQWKDK